MNVFQACQDLGKGSCFFRKIFGILQIMAYMSIVGCISFDLLSAWAFVGMLGIPLSYVSTLQMKYLYEEKVKLIKSSRLAILIQTLISLILLITVMITGGKG